MSTIREFFKHRCATAVAKARIAASINHLGLRGYAREVFISDVLETVIPPEVKIGSGEISDKSGTPSRQQDIILYSPSIAPPLLFDVRSGTFPIESALYTIEVKSKITMDELRTSVENARSVICLKTTSTDHWRPTGGFPFVGRTSSDTPHPLNSLIAFDSDLTVGGRNELERYLEVDDLVKIRPSIPNICVVGRGYWYSTADGWRHLPATPDHQELIGFVAGIVNTLPQILAAKGRPQFGDYLCPEPSFTELELDGSPRTSRSS